MADSDITESARRIAEAAMRGEYGSIVNEEDFDGEPGAGLYGGFKNMNKKKMMMISGAALGAVLVVGAVVGGFYYWKKHRKTN